MITRVVALTGARTSAFELGVIGEVFGLDRGPEGLPVFDFAVCTADPGPVPTNAGYAVHVAHGLEALADADLVAVPAWHPDDTAGAARVAPALLAAHERGAVVLSVCSGAFLLAMAGLLDGRRATTHWKYADLLRRRFPAVHVDPDALYVDEGDVITSAGTSAGIDACLHLLRRERGAAVANAVARRMVVPPQRKGGQAQFIEHSPRLQRERDHLGDVLAWAQEHLAEPLPVARLAARAHMSTRTFARRFREVAGTTPHQWLLEQRLLLAEELLETTGLTVEAVARASGLGTAEALRRHLVRRRGVSPLAYRQTFRAG